MKPVTIAILGEPVPWAQNSNPNAVREGVRYRPIPQKQKNAFAVIRFAAVQAMQESGNQEPFDGAVKLTLLAERPIPKSFSKKKRDAAIRHEIWPKGKPDLSKYLRLCEDAIKGVVYTDDARICGHENWKWYGIQPKTVITITPLEEIST